MIHKKIILSLILSFTLGLIELKAQNAMYINEKSGIKTTIELSSIRKLTFPTGKIEVLKMNGDISNYTLSEIQYLNFTAFTTSVTSIANNKILVYPNPTSDWIHISYKTGTAEKVIVAIVDIQGKILLQQYSNNQDGTGLTSINVSQLTKGLYICRVQDGTNLQTFKFLKY